MLTRAGYVIIFWGLTLLIAGVGSSNLFLIGVSLIPFGMFLVGAALDNPHGIEAEVEVSNPNPHAGQEVRVTMHYVIARGVGPVEFHQELPDVFTLAPNQKNLHVVVKGFRRVEGSYTFAVIATKRGTYELEPLEVEAAHIIGLKAAAKGTVGNAFPIAVRPKPAAVTRVRGLAGFASQLFPENDLAKTGIKTNDFRDLRRYQPGDAVKIINWKATTRQPSFHQRVTGPLVNEYEVEGKKSVWIFFDAAPYMEVGTNAENSFEHAIDAAHGIASFYLDRGYKLGAYIYNHGATEVLYPDIGGKQLLRLTTALTNLKTGRGGEGLLSAIDKNKRYLLQERPLIVVVTRLAKAGDETFMALRRLRAMSGRRRRRLPVLVVNPVVHNLIPSQDPWSADAAEILRRLERPAVDKARRLGARVVEWDPRRQRFESVLLHGAAQ
ncbi:MAG: DUF58 domain-containing protein [Thermoplasmatota archaeon]